MKIEKIELKNFKAFSDSEIQLYGKSTVFFGINGMGKTSLLRAVNLLYAKIINQTVNRKELRQKYNIELDDIRHGTSETEIKGTFILNDKSRIEYLRKMTKKDGKRSHSKEGLDKIVETIQQSYFSDEKQENIPLFVNYGTNRLVLDIPLRIKTHHEFDIYSAYDKAIENKVDFRTFFEWFRNQEDAENAEKVQERNFKYEDKSLKAVRKAIFAMLPDFRNLHVTRKPRLAMVVEKNGMSLNVSQLSDGEKCVLAVLGDLARRLTIANPLLDNPLEGTGVVLIDEIELHMHPSWQRKILGVLRETFPNIQFIITTHSPQVLGEVDESWNLFALSQSDKQNVAVEKTEQMNGFDSNYILEEFMGTKSINPDFQKILDEANKAICDNKFDKAKKEIEKVKKITGLNSAAVIELEGNLKRGEWLYEKNH
jgi:predicted ATP-binding protein involved in virulence